MEHRHLAGTVLFGPAKSLLENCHEVVHTGMIQADSPVKRKNYMNPCIA
jgi:hypothetical protein